MFGTPSTGSNTGNTGLFGSTNNSTSGGLFGSSSSTNNSTSGTGLFGSSTSGNTNSGGGLFGSSNNSGTGLFGNQNNNSNTGSGGLFGNSNATNTSNNSGGLFGNKNNQNSNNLFGNTNSNTGGSGLFGSSNTNTNSSGGLFGNSNTNSNTSGGLFGNNNNSNTGGGLFGNKSNTNSTGLFGNQNTGSGGLFGNSNNVGSQGTSTGLNLQQQLINAANGPWWFRELLSIHAAYSFGQGNKFQTMMYEVVGVAPDLLCVPGAVAPAYIDHVKTQRKQLIFQNLPWVDQRDWQKAEDANPDPNNWMPTPIIGIEMLHDRVGRQASHTREQMAMLSEPSAGSEVSTAQNKTDASNAPADGGQLAKQSQMIVKSESNKKTQNENAWIVGLEAGDFFEEKVDHCRHEHTRLTRRLIKVMGRLERLICAGSKRRPTPAEQQFHSRLEQLQHNLNNPKGCKAQLHQIATQLSMSDVYNNGRRHENSGTPGGLFGLNDEEEQAVFNYLENQRDGLEQLMKIVKKDMRDLAIIQNKIAPHGR